MTKELTKSALHGVIPPLVTPLDEQGEVDRRSLERVVSDQLDAGVHGVFVGGSTGEIALLDTARRTAAIEVVTGTVAGAVPVLAEPWTPGLCGWWSTRGRRCGSAPTPWW